MKFVNCKLQTHHHHPPSCCTVVKVGKARSLFHIEPDAASNAPPAGKPGKPPLSAKGNKPSSRGGPKNGAPGSEKTHHPLHTNVSVFGLEPTPVLYETKTVDDSTCPTFDFEFKIPLDRPEQMVEVMSSKPMVFSVFQLLLNEAERAEKKAIKDKAAAKGAKPAKGAPPPPTGPMVVTQRVVDDDVIRVGDVTINMNDLLYNKAINGWFPVEVDDVSMARARSLAATWENDIDSLRPEVFLEISLSRPLVTEADLQDSLRFTVTVENLDQLPRLWEEDVERLDESIALAYNLPITAADRKRIEMTAPASAITPVEPDSGAGAERPRRSVKKTFTHSSLLLQPGWVRLQQIAAENKPFVIEVAGERVARDPKDAELGTSKRAVACVSLRSLLKPNATTTSQTVLLREFVPPPPPEEVDDTKAGGKKGAPAKKLAAPKRGKIDPKTGLEVPAETFDEAQTSLRVTLCLSRPFVARKPELELSQLLGAGAAGEAGAEAGAAAGGPLAKPRLASAEVVAARLGTVRGVVAATVAAAHARGAAGEGEGLEAAALGRLRATGAFQSCIGQLAPALRSFVRQHMYAPAAAPAAAAPAAAPAAGLDGQLNLVYNLVVSNMGGGSSTSAGSVSDRSADAEESRAVMLEWLAINGQWRLAELHLRGNIGRASGDEQVAQAYYKYAVWALRRPPAAKDATKKTDTSDATNANDADAVHDVAEACLRRALQLCPGLLSARVAFTALLLNKDLWEEAEPHLELLRHSAEAEHPLVLMLHGAYYRLSEEDERHEDVVARARAVLQLGGAQLDALEAALLGHACFAGCVTTPLRMVSDPQLYAARVLASLRLHRLALTELAPLCPADAGARAAPAGAQTSFEVVGPYLVKASILLQSGSDGWLELSAMVSGYLAAQSGARAARGRPDSTRDMRDEAIVAALQGSLLFRARRFGDSTLRFERHLALLEDLRTVGAFLRFDPVVLLRLGWLYNNAHNVDAALELFQRLEESVSAYTRVVDNPYLFLGTSEARLRQLDFDAAERAITRASLLDSWNPRVWGMLAKVHLSAALHHGPANKVVFESHLSEARNAYKLMAYFQLDDATLAGELAELLRRLSMEDLADECAAVQAQLLLEV
jgi:hypothetical protein